MSCRRSSQWTRPPNATDWAAKRKDWVPGSSSATSPLCDDNPESPHRTHDRLARQRSVVSRSHPASLRGSEAGRSCTCRCHPSQRSTNVRPGSRWSLPSLGVVQVDALPSDPGGRHRWKWPRSRSPVLTMRCPPYHEVSPDPPRLLPAPDVRLVSPSSRLSGVSVPSCLFARL